MPLTLTIPDDYGYVLLSATAASFLTALHTLRTAKFRKLAKIPYPNTYATAEQASASEPAYLFNCAQRAHANFLEAQPSAITTLLIAGLEYPRAAAGLGLAWCFARGLYLYGYTKPIEKGNVNGSGRRVGGWGSLALLGLFGMSAATGYKFIMRA
ncbi:MAG: hypothetical protein M1834_006818 [Cirrosporium novae-zelandiae]|nr:MAG: hypothetical protein M1834_006818 [Cirrosporium novae-zelandiae]